MLEQLGINAKTASADLVGASTELKNKALGAIANALIQNAQKIIDANKIDYDSQLGILDSGMLDRLMLNLDRIKGMADGCRQVMALDDPCGRVLETVERPNGLVIKKVSCPMGVIGIIYEARPNVTADAAALCLKSGNAVILRGGKEAIHSNIAISDIMREAVKSVGLDENVIQLVHDTSRESSTELMRMKGTLDCLIPRGSKRLIQAVVENASVPVIETGSGNCHIYVDESADVDMAASIIFNAKTSRPSVCNAIETILVHKNIAQKALPEIKKLLDTKNVEIRGCETTRKILGDSVIPATEEDYAKEFLDYILAVKVVDSLDDAIDHIAKYSTGHSESIITNDYNNANKFTACVDSAAVYVNASTRFTDGGEFGLGAEIGISTQKLHARGPMGLNELTSCKFIIRGNGQIR